MIPPPIDIIARLRDRATAGTRSDQRLATLVLNEPDQAASATIMLLARRAEVSEATVTRFCRALGCAGFSDFRLRLARAVATTGQYLKSHAGVNEGDARVPGLIAAGAHGAIEAVCGGIDTESLARAADLLANAQIVRAYGSGGGSSMAATEMEIRLFRLGIAATSHSDGEVQQMTAAVGRPGTVIVAFSVSGEVRSVVDAAVIARMYGAEVIALTAPGSSLAAAASLVLPFRVDEGTDVLRPSAARYALLALIDMVAMSVAERRAAPSIEAMRRIKHHQMLNKRGDAHLPLGD